MQFYRVFFLSLVCLVSGASMAAYENADIIIEAIAIEQGVPVSRLVLPRGAKVALNQAECLRQPSGGRSHMEDRLLLPHPDRTASLPFLAQGSGFPQNVAEALESFFFPKPDGLYPNVVPKNDPISNLNRSKAKAPEQKDAASRTLGTIVRFAHDVMTRQVILDDHVVNTLLKIWGLADPEKIKVFQTVSKEQFSHQEFMNGLLKGVDVLKQYLEVTEVEEDPELQALSKKMGTDDEFSSFIHHFLPGLFTRGYLKEKDLEDWKKNPPAKMQEETLKRLRKRHLAHLITEQLRVDVQQGKSPDESSLLSILMSFFWKTSDGDGLKPFYEGFFRQNFDWDKDKVMAFNLALPRGVLMEKLGHVEKNPVAFWGLSDSQQAHLLNFEESERLFRMPEYGTAVLRNGRDFSDCMETAIRRFIYHLLRNPKTHAMEGDLLPKGRFYDYFIGSSDEDKRLSPVSRNVWAVMMTETPGVNFLKAEYELEPSVENFIWVLQSMMEDGAIVVQPITDEVDQEKLIKGYEDFLVRAGEWFSGHLKRPVAFELSDAEMICQQPPRTSGMVNLKLASEGEEGLREVGYINFNLTHAEYDVNSFGGTMGGGAQAVDPEVPLVEQVWDQADTLAKKVSLLPWMTAALMQKVIGDKGDEAEQLKKSIPQRWHQLNFSDYPALYIDVLRLAILSGRAESMAPEIFIGGFLNEPWENGRDAALMIHRLLQNPETAPLVSDAVLDQLVLANPDFLGELPLHDPRGGATRVKSMLELMVEKERWDVLREVSPKVSDLTFELHHQELFTTPFWQKIDKAAGALQHVKKITFMNIHQALQKDSVKKVVEELTEISLKHPEHLSDSKAWVSALDTTLLLSKEEKEKFSTVFRQLIGLRQEEWERGLCQDFQKVRKLMSNDESGFLDALEKPYLLTEEAWQNFSDSVKKDYVLLAFERFPKAISPIQQDIKNPVSSSALDGDDEKEYSNSLEEKLEEQKAMQEIKELNTSLERIGHLARSIRERRENFPKYLEEVRLLLTKRQDELYGSLAKISFFNASEILFYDFNPSILENFVPTFGPNLRTIRYTTEWHASLSVDQIEAQLNQKFAELQAAGKIGPDVVLTSARD